jgi:hypothetical protein
MAHGSSEKHNGILCSHEEELNVIIRWQMDGIGEHHSE